MVTSATTSQIAVFATCPPSSGYDSQAYLNEVVRIAQWSEQAGCKGILVYADNSLVDPWLVSQIILQHTHFLCPLVAVQPIYMHPYSVAKMVASLGFLHGRRLYLNVVAGGFKNDLIALNDPTPHDKRYDRLIEYTAIITCLLAGAGPVTYRGDFYKVVNLKLSPALPPDLLPGIMISGSSEAGLKAAKTIGAIAIQYPKPASEYRSSPPDPAMESGIRVGIVCRDRDEEAWDVAYSYFPEDRKGQFARQLATKVSDSAWHKQLSEISPVATEGPYWLVPFHNYKTMCPYLVGSYERVAQELGAYIAAGYQTFILDIPRSAEELAHTQRAFARAIEVMTCRNSSNNG